MSRVGWIALLSFATVVAFVAYLSLQLTGANCEVCMSYRGAVQCRTVSAATEEEALQGAVVNACAFISGGVTDSMACQRQEPVSKRCW